MDDDASDKNEFVISYEILPIPVQSDSSVDTVTLKGSSSNITLIRNKRKDDGDRSKEPPKIVGKHKNYFECDECKNGFSMLKPNEC